MIIQAGAALLALRVRVRRMPPREPAPGMRGAQLNRTQSRCLFVLTNWAIRNKRSAVFSPFRLGAKADDDYGTWQWLSEGYDIKLTALPRGTMIEVGRAGEEHAFIAGVWNNVLHDWNDVVVETANPRVHVKRITGLTVSKSLGARMRQAARIALKRCGCWRATRDGER